MNLYFLRHGETEQNLKKTYYGDIDCELTPKGISQCEKAGDFLKDISFDRVFLSERKRAAQSTEIVLRGRSPLALQVDSRLNEMSFGAFEGLTYSEIMKLYPKEQKEWEADWKSFCPPGGESCERVYERVRSFMEDIRKLEAQNVLLVTHGGVIRTVYSYILNENLDLYWKFASKNGDITIIKYEYGNFYIDSIVHMD